MLPYTASRAEERRVSPDRGYGMEEHRPAYGAPINGKVHDITAPKSSASGAGRTNGKGQESHGCQHERLPTRGGNRTDNLHANGHTQDISALEKAKAPGWATVRETGKHFEGTRVPRWATRLPSSSNISPARPSRDNATTSPREPQVRTPGFPKTPTVLADISQTATHSMFPD